MRIELYGLTFETPGVTVHLWSPWRCAQIEIKLFDAIKAIPDLLTERQPDELRLHLTDKAKWRVALQNMERTLKGWQEEGSDANERRLWRWLIEADIDAHGYDQNGEKASLWAFLHLGIERNEGNQKESWETIDLNGFGLRLWNIDEEIKS